LVLTNSEFPVVKLTIKSRNVLFDGEKLIMKIVKEEKRQIKANKEKGNVSNDLFLKLKELRYELAQKKNVPAFIIFSDASLMDMCDKMPTNEIDFLEVSGVGQIKLKGYGKEFLEVINNYTRDET
ncbi:MAG TPA: HRDC domain-containing protein, partial [Clostridia bacterium]|nr:HRDC domain-containing protein [Clostridia bacterium]